MPIYCLNGKQSTRKRSNSFIGEMVGATTNYYISNNAQQLSMASYQILFDKSHKSLTSCSLMMAVARFRHSIQNMKDTVLIPTRLGDLRPIEQQLLLQQADTPSTLTTHNELTEVENGDCTNFSAFSCAQIEFSSSASTGTSVSSHVPTSKSSDIMKISMNQHNLYEQYKLLDLIDKILSSDASLVSSGSQRVLSPNATILFNILEKDDDNYNNYQNGNNNNYINNENTTKLSMEDCDKSIDQTCDCGDNYMNNTKKLLPNSGNNNNNNNNNSNHSIIDRSTTPLGGNVYNRIDHSVAHRIGCKMGSPEASRIPSNEIHTLDHCRVHCVDTNCSLMKIKDQLEYHLVSLKSILALMSTSADHITQKYLEDIHCDDRFEKQLKSCEQSEQSLSSGSSSNTNRHYYTSNSVKNNALH